MKNRWKVISAVALALAVSGLTWGLWGCGSSTVKSRASDLVQGDHVILRLAKTSQGELAINGVDVKADGDQDNVECENGIAPDGTYCEGGPSANKDDGNEAEGKDGKEGKEEDDDDVSPMLVGKVHVSPDKTARVLWMKVILPSTAQVTDLATYRLMGKLAAGAQLAVSAVSKTAKETPRVMGRIERIAKRADGRLEIQILGHTLTVNPNLKVRTLSSLTQSVKADTDGDTDKDGVICEQQGQHEGNNEGC